MSDKTGPKATSAPEKKKEHKLKSKKLAHALNVKGSHAKQYLMMMNPYAQSILDPFTVRGARIPDPVMYPSVPFSLIQNFTLTANAQGLCGFALGASANASSTNIAGLVPQDTGGTSSAWILGMLFGTSATAADLTAGTGGTSAGITNIKWAQWNETTNVVRTLYSKVRLVSFGVSIIFTGQLLNAQGKITMVSAPRLWRSQRIQADAGLPLSTLQNAPGVAIMSVPKGNGGTAVYKPQDNVSLEYSDLSITNNASVTQNLQFRGGELYVVVDGAVANQTFFVRLCANYEGIPDLNNYMSTMMQASPSKSDPIALSQALNVASDTPSVTPKVPPVTSSINSTGHIEHLEPHKSQEKTIMETVLDDLEWGAGKVAKIGKSLTPLATAFMGML